MYLIQSLEERLLNNYLLKSITYLLHISICWLSLDIAVSFCAEMTTTRYPVLPKC